MTLEERVAELEVALLRTQAKATGASFVYSFMLSSILGRFPEVARELAAMANGATKITSLPPSFVAKPEFAQVLEQQIREVAAALVDPHSS